MSGFQFLCGVWDTSFHCLLVNTKHMDDGAAWARETLGMRGRPKQWGCWEPDCKEVSRPESFILPSLMPCSALMPRCRQVDECKRTSWSLIEKRKRWKNI
jgi:hypothetical protein